MDSPNKLSFVGLEVTAREVAWVDVPEDEAVQLSNVRTLFIPHTPRQRHTRLTDSVCTYAQNGD